jgi:WD40 repeat protein
MYVIEHPQAGSTAYNVRLYDLRAQSLSPDIIFDKATVAQYDPAVGLMDGTFHVSVAPTKGDWSFGLYMRPNGSPFVHALNVPGHYATCIVDLAGTWTPASMFSMALSDDGRSLYVVDPAGGTVSVLDALTQKVARKATFATRGAGDPHAASAVISPDGTRLYASAARGIAILQTSDLSLKGWAAADLAVRSLAISSDGARLFALSGDTVQVVDAASGRVLSLLAISAGARSIHLLAREPVAAR